MQDLVTTAEALEIIGIKSPSTISRLVQQGRLTPATKLAGVRGGYLFDRSEVERFAKERAA